MENFFVSDLDFLVILVQLYSVCHHVKILSKGALGEGSFSMLGFRHQKNRFCFTRVQVCHPMHPPENYQPLTQCVMLNSFWSWPGRSVS